MSTLKRFWVRLGEDEVLLEVDMSILTPELAAEINGFWNGAEARLRDQGGEVVQTVVRLFGARAIFCMQADGGAFVACYRWISDEDVAAYQRIMNENESKDAP